MANLRQALEHVGDAEWLREFSPIATTWAVEAAQKPAAPARPPSTGVKALDDLLAAIWSDWESRPKTGLQTLLWSAVSGMRESGDSAGAASISVPALLLLTYFQDPRPKQADLIKQLAVGQSTFYRQLGAAVEALEGAVIAYLQPSLKLESPTLRPLIGREGLIKACASALLSGGVVNLIGASGLGKTSAGAAAADAWRKVAQAQPGAPPDRDRRGSAMFWYTIRPGVTDNTQHLIYSLALFLHQLGASNLWLHLLAKPEEIGPGKAMSMIRKALEELSPAPALFCFDEADLLLPDELNDSDEHRQLRALLEEFAESPRQGSPILFIGQRLLMSPERSHLFSVERFNDAQARVMAEQAGLNLDEPALQSVMRHTRGNPLLLHLLIALHQLGEPVLAQPALLASTVSLDWFVTRLRRHLSDKEQSLLDAVCVFESAAPASLWRKQGKAIDRLCTLNLIERDPAGDIRMLPALRDALYRQQPADARSALHLSAGQGCAELGMFTQAARHYVLGGQAEMAVWVWRAHRDAEIRQGQAQTALGIFAPLQQADRVALSDERDRKALALMLADLYHLAGQHEAGLAALEGNSWLPSRASSAHAHELRGKLLAMRGDIERSLQDYRLSLDALDALLPTKPVLLRVELARQTHARTRQVAEAARDATLAKHDVEVLLGEIEEEAGHLDAAYARYVEALAAARVSGDPVRLAKACEMLGIVEARRLNVDAAQGYLAEAGAHYQSYGNLVCAVGMTKCNMAFAYVMARRWRDAVAPAQEAMAFFEDMRQPYYLAINQANLAEAYANLGDVEQAEALAWRALAQEEAVVRPQCLYVMAQVRRAQGQLPEAERLSREAAGAAEQNQDLWSRAYARRVLGQVLRDLGRDAEARESLAEAGAAFEELGLHADAEMIAHEMSVPRVAS